LTAQLGILYRRAEEQDTAMGYMVDHSASMLLLDPQVRLSAIFSAPYNTRAMAEDFRTISANNQSP
jgi:protein SCO1/2